MIRQFKFQLTIHELRSFHRPEFNPDLNTKISFKRVKNAKSTKREIKSKDTDDVMRNVKDLSLRDNSKYVLLEYSVI